MKNYLLDPRGGDFVLVTDATCDLTPEERERYGIWREVPHLSVTVNDQEVPIDNIDDFYGHLTDGSYPPDKIRTAASGPMEVCEVLEEIVRKTPSDVRIIYAGTSEHISAGTKNAFAVAMKQILPEKFPEREFVAIDTMCTSNGQGLALQMLAKYEGDDLVAYAQWVGQHLAHIFTQRELAFSARSGRYGVLQSTLMKAISGVLAPFMYFPSDDKLTIAPALIPTRKLLEEWVSYFMAHYDERYPVLRIGYGGDQERRRAEIFVRKLRAAGLPEDFEVQMARVGPVVGAHTGPTVLSMFFVQKDLRPVKGKDLQWGKRHKVTE